MNATHQITGQTVPAHAVPSRRSESVDRFRVRPADVTAEGVVSGATLLDRFDHIAQRTAEQWCGTRSVLASVGNFHLDRPITVGNTVEIQANLVYTGRCSMHLLITVRVDDAVGRSHTAQIAMVFVAIDAAGTPVEVPPFTPFTMLELQRHRQARVRTRMRRRIEEAMANQEYSPGQVTARHIAPAGGGRILRWIDEAACRCGSQWTGTATVTSYVARIRFHAPVRGDTAVEVSARILHTGPRSIHIGVRVAPVGAPDSLIAHAVIVVISPRLREQQPPGAAEYVPEWIPRDDHDRRLDAHARHLKALRAFIEPFTCATQIADDTERR